MNEKTNIGMKIISQKLPDEHEHLMALNRMRALDSYYRWTFQLLRPWIGRRVLDAGCGVGNFTELLEEVAEYVLAVDLSPENLAELSNRFRHSNVIEIAQFDLDTDGRNLSDKKFDTIVCLDVLEHVENDTELLRTFWDIIQPGGHLLVKVPACPWLFGAVDEASGHFRRYTPRELHRKAEMTGWIPVRTCYMNVFGVLPYWLKSRLLRRRANFSRTFKPWQLRIMRDLIPVLQIADRLIGPPIGQSAILVARKNKL